MAAALSREAAARTAGERMTVDVQGRKVEVEVQKDGRVIGHANATLNLDRMLPGVLGLRPPRSGRDPVRDRSTGCSSTRQEASDKDAAAGSRRRTNGDGGARRDTSPNAATGSSSRAAAPSGIIFGIARPIGDSLREIRRASVRNLGLGLLVIALAFVGIIPDLAPDDAAPRHAYAAVCASSPAATSARACPCGRQDEFGALAGAFNQMADDLERHEALVVEQERLHRELELSRLIQTEMLPRGSLRSGPAEIGGVSIPAREVGGDFFNYFVLPDGRLALLVGDVSGKGVSAALLMANIQATLRARLAA